MTKKKIGTMELPGKFVFWYDLKAPPRGPVRIAVGPHDNLLVARLDGKRWTLAPVNGSPQSVGGVVGGYNIYAVDVGYCLASLGLWRKKDAEEFEQHIMKLRIAREHDHRITRLVSQLRRLGYKITPPKKGKS